ncbi:hypothetical protein A8F94_06565 [Bacillus sp. FJAT-27225]|uniref:hypothetical protein n=1 Tax=Bacillus sp. FJAT-27225 TaxID=1743144 RepID=UPI00080C3502|nr:hypothetical protein [Bacillus sp. FJAT-27225]OCA87526.1 hypothetical protein A8F94_06565 [Bacillus sp. FJAT-27225]
MIELKLRNILRQVKNDNPQKRYNALDELFVYKSTENLEVQIDVLKDMIKTAAGTFPEPVDRWDNPSYYLTDFVCDFPMAEVVESLIKHFDGLSLLAKERATEFLLGTENEKIFFFLEEKLVGLINDSEEFVIPVTELSSYPVLSRDILDKTLSKLQSSHYKYMMYDLILAVNASGLELGYKSEAILPSILEDYHGTKQQYMKFDSDYSTKYVYSSWKDNYFYIRSRMRLFISLMEYYFTSETENELKEALQFRDPVIKSEAMLACLAKNLPVEPKVIYDCAENIESAEMVYWELHSKNREHLYPIKDGKQQHLAKTRLFSTIINLPEDEEGVGHFPENIQVIDKIDTENFYGQPVRYLMMSFEELGRTYVGWVGGFALEDGDDTAHLWDGTYTEFVELDSMLIDEHKQVFFKSREEEKADYMNSVYFESKPKLSKGLWFFIALVITHWVRIALDGFQGPFWPSLAFTALGGALALYELQKNKTRSISIVGQQLVMRDGKKAQNIALHDIKRVEYNKKHIMVYGRDKQLALKFPLKWVRYELFYHHMKEHTSHLKETPFVQPY